VTLVACVSVLLAALAALLMSASRTVYLLDFAIYKPPDRCAAQARMCMHVHACACLGVFASQLASGCMCPDVHACIMHRHLATRRSMHTESIHMHVCAHAYL
jgi:hypothetical protein